MTNMSPDDETFLSAFLDGQLDPELHQDVESELSSNPRLAAELRSLAAVRDLLAGLSHPSPRDSRPPVMSRIRSRSARLHPRAEGRRWWTLAPRTLSRASTALALAAGIALFVILFNPPILHGPAIRRPPLVAARPAAPEPKAPGADSIPAGSLADAVPAHSLGVSKAAEDASWDVPRTSPASPTTADLAHDSEAPDLQRVRQLLDSPHLRRIFLVTDVLEEPAQKEVASVVEQSTRYDYFKITVAQGIVIDPRHPERASVFALVLDESELDQFRHRLTKAFPQKVKEDDVVSGLVTQLADIGQVVSFPSHPVADVIIPRQQVAIRTPEIAGRAQTPRSTPPLPSASGQPTLEQERSAPVLPLTINAPEKSTGAHANLSPPTHTAGQSDDRTPSPSLSAHAATPRPTPASNEPTPRRSPALSSGPDPRPVVVLVWIVGPRSG